MKSEQPHNEYNGRSKLPPPLRPLVPLWNDESVRRIIVGALGFLLVTLTTLYVQQQKETNERQDGLFIKYIKDHDDRHRADNVAHADKNKEQDDRMKWMTDRYEVVRDEQINRKQRVEQIIKLEEKVYQLEREALVRAERIKTLEEYILRQYPDFQPAPRTFRQQRSH